MNATNIDQLIRTMRDSNQHLDARTRISVCEEFITLFREMKGDWSEVTDFLETTIRESQSKAAEDEMKEKERLKTLTRTGYWLNEKTGVRHTLLCEHYGKSREGRICECYEGRACKECGGW